MACFIGSGCGSLSLSRRPCRGGRWVCRVEGEEGEGGGGKGEKVSVVVAGATGRTGRLVIKELLKREEGGRKIRAVVRDRQAAEKLLGSDDRLEYVVADVRRNDDALKDAFKDAKYLISCVGSTALPSSAWENGANKPKQVLDDGLNNIIDCLTPGTIEKVVLITTIGTRRPGLPFKIFDVIGGAWSASLAAEEAVINGAEEKDYAYSILHLPSLMDLGLVGPKQGVKLRIGDIGMSSEKLQRETAAELCVECIERDDIGRAFVATPINVVGEKPDWDAAFDAVTGSPVVLKLIFDNINVEKFKSWLLNWASTLLTNSALFPPLPLPIRIDPTENGVKLTFLRVSVGGSVQAVGCLEMSLEDKTLFIRRGQGQFKSLPGEKQVMELLVESLDSVTK